jgi:hypothetical protein
VTNFTIIAIFDRILIWCFQSIILLST